MLDEPQVQRVTTEDRRTARVATDRSGAVYDPYDTHAQHRTASYTRFSPARIVTGIAGIVLLVIGLIAMAKGGFGGSITDNVVSVAGFDHTTLLGIIDAALGLILLIIALAGTEGGARSAGVFFGVLIAVGGIVLAATPDSFSDTLAAGAGFGIFCVILGAVVALANLVLPSLAQSRVTYR
jgi:hypothetical protein